MTEEKYCLFGGDGYYSLGGANDFMAFGSIDELKLFFDDFLKKCPLGVQDCWGQIVDHDTMKLVFETHEIYHGKKSYEILWRQAKQFG